MSSVADLTGMIERKGVAAREAEAALKAKYKESVLDELMNFIDGLMNESFLEALEMKKQYFVCLRFPDNEITGTRKGNIFADAVKEVVEEHNAGNPECVFKFLTDVDVIQRIIDEKNERLHKGEHELTLKNVVVVYIGQ